MAQGSSCTKRKGSGNIIIWSEPQYHHHCHRLTTMTTTSDDNDNVDQDDIMREDDVSPHLSHPGTENPENPNQFHNFPLFFSKFGHILPDFCSYFCLVCGGWGYWHMAENCRFSLVFPALLAIYCQIFVHIFALYVEGWGYWHTSCPFPAGHLHGCAEWIPSKSWRVLLPIAEWKLPSQLLTSLDDYVTMSQHSCNSPVRAPQKGPKKWCRAKIVEKLFEAFWRFLTIFALREYCRKVSKNFLTLFDDFDVFWRGPFPPAPFVIRSYLEGFGRC